MKWYHWLFFVILIFLVIGLFFGMLFVGYSKDNTYQVKDLSRQVEELQTDVDNKQTESTTVDSNTAYAPAPAATTNDSTTTESAVVVKWTRENPTNYLPSYCYTIGDDVVGGKVCYDEGGQGQTTIVFNLSNQPVEVYGEWGSGDATPISQSVDVQMQVNDVVNSQWGQIDSSGKYVWNEVRVVIVDKNGTVHDLPVLTKRWNTIDISEFTK